MLSCCFLGANTKDGFCSLYGGFPSDPGAVLHIIKGGPGTGKSGFMRALAAAAEKKGLEVQYVLCSGDPDSLDGIYIPALKQAWADGTSPHTLETGCFGVDSDYVNLGAFCRTPLGSDDRVAVRELTQRYKAEYAAAYSYISAAEALHEVCNSDIFGESGKAAMRMRIRAILGGCQPEEKSAAHNERVFLSAMSCRGMLRLDSSVKKQCRHIIRADGKTGGDELFLSLALEEARERSLGAVFCPSPLDPSRPDAVIIPSLSLAFLSSGWNDTAYLTVNTDSAADPELRAAAAEARTSAERLRESCLALAGERLASAKRLHDELEGYYGLYTDFPSLTDFTQSCIKTYIL